MQSPRHVDYILAAEFHLDKGSCLTYHYPNQPIYYKETLAEQMLPEGAHLFHSDWTIFFLNKHYFTSPPPATTSPSTADKTITTTANSSPLLFVLNHVATKLDKNSKRGARMVALAVASRHHFIHAFKPVLILAMLEYIENPNESVLLSLYTAINNMDLSKMPTLSLAERLILRNASSSDSASILFERMWSVSTNKDTPTQLVNSKSNQSAVRKCSTNPLGSSISTRTIKDPNFYASSLVYKNKQIPLRIPMTVLSPTEEIGDYSLIHLFSKFALHAPFLPPYSNVLLPHGASTPAIMVLFNAILSHHSVLFVGHNMPANEVAGFVLAACAFASGAGGVLRTFTERAFPYTCLANVDQLLACPGYIAGVTNPFFEEKSQWWDVCANVVTGKIRISPNIKSNPVVQLPPSRSFLPSFFSTSSNDTKRWSIPSRAMDPVVKDPRWLKQMPTMQTSMTEISSPRAHISINSSVSEPNISDTATVFSVRNGMILKDSGFLKNAYPEPSLYEDITNDSSSDPFLDFTEDDYVDETDAFPDHPHVSDHYARQEPGVSGINSFPFSYSVPGALHGLQNERQSPSISSTSPTVAHNHITRESNDQIRQATNVKETGLCSLMSIEAALIFTISTVSDTYQEPITLSQTSSSISISSTVPSTTSPTTSLKPRNRTGSIIAQEPTLDHMFVDAVYAAIEAHLSEAHVRMLVHQFVQQWVRMAGIQELLVYKKSACYHPLLQTPHQGPVFTSLEARTRELDTRSALYSAWRSLSPSYAAFVADVRDDPNLLLGRVGNVDVLHWLERLVLVSDMNVEEIDTLYTQLLASVSSDDDILLLLSHLPILNGGLMPLAAPGLFHPDDRVRRKTRRFLHRIHLFPLGDAYIQALNPFVRTQYLRGIH